MYRVSGLDFVGAQRLIVLHNPTRVDKALSLNGDILKFWSSEFGLQAGYGGGLGHGDGMGFVARGLDLEGDLGVGGALCGVGHLQARERWLE